MANASASVHGDAVGNRHGPARRGARLAAGQGDRGETSPPSPSSPQQEEEGMDVSARDAVEKVLSGERGKGIEKAVKNVIALRAAR